MIPVAAEKLFQLGPLPVTNSILTGWIAVAGFVLLALAVRSSAKLVPTGVQNLMEALLEQMLSFMDQVTQSREKSRRFLPIVGTLFLFILACNWMGLIPGVGTIGIHEATEEGTELVPLFRAATSDLNMTAAMGLAAVVLSHIIGVFTIGLFTHVGKFVQLGTLWKAVSKLGKVKAGEYALGVFQALVEMLVGVIEIVSEVAKVVSLSLRLFGNVFAGEVLIHVLSSLVAYAVPVPFMFLEVIVGVVQALVFAMLTLTYLTLATEKPHGDEHAHEEDEMGEAHGLSQTAPS